MKKGRLILADGWIATGYALGVTGRAMGRLAPHTEMTGYQEILADPACGDQIVCMTYPLIGNVGVQTSTGEESSIQARGLLLREPQRLFSSWTGSQSLPEWIQASQTIALGGVDTREVMRHVRIHGGMQAVLTTDPDDDAADMTALAATTPYSGVLRTIKLRAPASLSPFSCDGPGLQICVLDLGMSADFCDALRVRGCTVRILPWYADVHAIRATQADGLVLSAGPAVTTAEIQPLLQTLRLLAPELPVLGIGSGFQALALAHGWQQPAAMHQGHHGANLPVRDLRTGRVHITRQNHWLGWMADAAPARHAHTVTWLHLNDNTIEGLRFSSRVSGVQFIPDTHAHAFGTGHVWDQFLQAVMQAVKGSR